MGPGGCRYRPCSGGRRGGVCQGSDEGSLSGLVVRGEAGGGAWWWRVGDGTGALVPPPPVLTSHPSMDASAAGEAKAEGPHLQPGHARSQFAHLSNSTPVPSASVRVRQALLPPRWAESGRTPPPPLLQGGDRAGMRQGQDGAWRSVGSLGCTPSGGALGERASRGPYGRAPHVERHAVRDVRRHAARRYGGRHRHRVSHRRRPLSV